MIKLFSTITVLIQIICVVSVTGCFDSSSPVIPVSSIQKQKSISNLTKRNSIFETEISEVSDELKSWVWNNVPNNLKNEIWCASLKKYRNSNTYQIIYQKGKHKVSDGNGNNIPNNIDGFEETFIHKYIISESKNKKSILIQSKRSGKQNLTLVENNNILPLAEYGYSDPDPYPDQWRDAGSLYEHVQYQGRVYTWQYYFTGPAWYFMQNGELGNAASGYFHDITSSIKMYTTGVTQFSWSYHEHPSLGGHYSQVSNAGIVPPFDLDENCLDSRYKVGNWNSGHNVACWIDLLGCTSANRNDKISSFTLHWYVSY